MVVTESNQNTEFIDIRGDTRGFSRRMNLGLSFSKVLSVFWTIYFCMDTDRVVSLLEMHVADVESYRRSEGVVVFQFTCPWRFERPADELKSAVTVDRRGRLEKSTVRPGPLPKDEIASQGHAVGVVEEALARTELGVEVGIEVKDYGQKYFRPHVEVSGMEMSSFSDWLGQFIDTYEAAFEVVGVEGGGEYQRNQSVFTCAYCEDSPATCLFQVGGDLSPKVSCDECAREQTVGVDLLGDEYTMWPESDSMPAKFWSVSPLWLRGAEGLYIREPDGKYVLSEESNVDCFSYLSTSNRASH
jgi:hypothetical protein